ncbi:hypothetical protein ASwh1_322 [Aeromonas phage Aswh_1]|nr:hypothetical protein ASwh1_322 [Aeromonas phage Aswh_1]
MKMIHHTYRVEYAKTIEISVKKFVKVYLKEIRPYKDDYDFFIQGPYGSGLLARKFSLPKSLFSMDISNFSLEKDTNRDMVKHIIDVIESNYKGK